MRRAGSRTMQHLALGAILFTVGCGGPPATGADAPAPSASSAPASADVPVADDACSNAATQAEMTRCWSDAAAAAERRVDESFQKVSDWLQQREQSDVLKMLAASQEQWQAYKQSHCEAVAAVYDGGSMAGLQGALCRARLNDQRRDELELIISDAAP